MSLHALAWLFIAGTVLHNVEESILLPKWTRHANSWPRAMGNVEFLFGAVALSALMTLVTAVATKSMPGAWSEYAVAGFALAMSLNAIVPHLALSLYKRTYMPGTGSALLLNLPLGCLFLQRALTMHEIKAATFYWFGPCVVIAMLALMPCLLYLGRQIESHHRRLPPHMILP
jgi:hypothetical protein